MVHAPPRGRPRGTFEHRWRREIRGELPKSVTGTILRRELRNADVAALQPTGPQQT